MKKITLFFILTLLSFSSCKTTSKTIKIGNFTFSHTTYDSWSSKNVLDDTVGEFCLKGNGETKLHEYILGSYAIKGKIRIQNEEREVCFIVDTGAVGNVIKSDVIKSLKSKFERKYSFYSSYTYSPEIREDQKGLFVPEFETDGFCIKDVLFEPLNVENLGCLQDGTEIDGFIGLRTLSELPFLFSAKDKKLVYFENEFLPEGNEYSFTTEYPYVIELPVVLNNKTYFAKLDTGGDTTLVPTKVFKSLSKKISGKVELRSRGFKRQIGLLDSIEVFGKECKNIPILAQNVDYVMIGEIVLRNFDIYLDYKNSKIYLNPVECNFSTRDMALIYTSNGNRYGGFGVNFARDKYNKRLRVASLYYIDNKKICKEMKIGDYVVSINGIPQEKFILEDLANLDKIEVELQRGKKTYKVNLNKNNFDNFGTY